MTESQHQSALIKWAMLTQHKYPELMLIYHIANGGRRDLIEAVNLKRQGVKAGVPDIHLPVARGKYHSLYIEMKTNVGKESPEQIWWREELTAQGCFSTVCYGFESARRILEWYLTLPK